MTEVVVVIRLKSGEDVIGIIMGERDGKILLDNPYYAKYSMATGNVSMMPYCPLTDETLFSFEKDNLEFMVTAAASVTTKFISLIEYFQMSQEKELAKALDDIIEPGFDNTIEIAGNDTKH